jgi:hypothetical protein
MKCLNFAQKEDRQTRRQTDRQTDGCTDIKVSSFVKMLFIVAPAEFTQLLAGGGQLQRQGQPPAFQLRRRDRLPPLARLLRGRRPLLRKGEDGRQTFYGRNLSICEIMGQSYETFGGRNLRIFVIS